MANEVVENDNMVKIGGMLTVVYPDGIKPDQYEEMLTAVKQMEGLIIGTNKQNGGKKKTSKAQQLKGVEASIGDGKSPEGSGGLAPEQLHRN